MADGEKGGRAGPAHRARARNGLPGFGAWLALVLLVGACATPLTAMVHPETGESRPCVSHLPPGLASLEMERCVAKLRESGFVKAEELTPEALAALGGRRSSARPPGPAPGSPGGRESPEAPPEAPPERGIWRRVTLVLDERTVVLDGGQPLRYVGIRPFEGDEAPPSVAHRAGALAFNRQLVEGQTVRLEFDVRMHDHEGRLWAYVYLVDGRLVNSLLVENGFARADPYQGYVKHAALFRQLEVEARGAGRGLWSLR